MLHVCCAKLKKMCIYAHVICGSAKEKKKKKQEANGILNLVGLVVNISQFGQTSRI